MGTIGRVADDHGVYQAVMQCASIVVYPTSKTRYLWYGFIVSQPKHTPSIQERNFPANSNRIGGRGNV